MRIWISILALIALAACGPITADTPQAEAVITTPPPLPEDAETVVFERDTEATADPKEATAADAETNAPVYWGIAEGEPLTQMWEDLLPEGSEEALIAEYEQFYAMLEKRYAAASTSLLDAGRYGGIAEGSELDYMPQLGTFDVVEELDQTLIRMPGYVVPFDFNTRRRHKTFLFVPYMGACIHSPPPPPNQIIFVRADPALRIKDIWAPYWIEGTLTTEKSENELGDAAYALSVDTLEPYLTP